MPHVCELAGPADSSSPSACPDCRLRASLGLKPLKMEASEPKGPSKAQQEAEEAKEKQAKEREAAELAERIAQ